ncbi:hypothetical protein [Paenibacillus sp. FSL P4-0288]|uniref:hypothetical protein n=1 Tax=Paenibacillus sp. FSL P4-0288 TaxID=2921633 RepID=UPI0030FAB16B
MKDFLVDLDKIRAVEVQLTLKMDASQDISCLDQTKIIKEQLNLLKSKTEELNLLYEEIMQNLTLESYTATFDIEITEGMLNQSYLSLKPMSRTHLSDSIIPEDGEEFDLSFPEPMGKITTSFIKKYNRLKDRGNVRYFYDYFGLIPGSIITFKQIVPKSEYSISIKSKF